MIRRDKHKSAKMQRGFSLLEMLISLTVISMIMLLIASGIKLISSSWDRNVERMDNHDAYTRLAALFHRDIEGIRRVTVQDKKKISYIFGGTEKSLSFVTGEPASVSKPGLYNVEYSQQKSSDGNTLVRKRRAFSGKYSDTKARPFRDNVTLLDRDFTYSFSYAEVSRNKTTWLGRWKDQDRLPEMIRLTVNYRNRPVSPPVIVRIIIDAEQECITKNSNQCSLRKLKGKAVKPGAARQ